MLSLEQKFDSFDRGSKCLGSDACKSSCEEIKEVEVVSSYLFGLGQVSIRHRNQYNQMKQYDVETQLSDLLTSYLQHFKSTLSTKLALIQSLCATNNSLQSNPQFLLSKFSNKVYKNDWPSDPQTYIVNQVHGSTLSRFYLRIREYLDYRLGGLLPVKEGILSQEMNNFQKQLEKRFRKYQNNLSEGKFIGELFALISQVEINFTNNLLNKIKTSKITTVKGVLDLELVQEIRDFIICKINQEQNQGLKTIVSNNQQESVTREIRLSFSSRNNQFVKIKTSIRKKIHSKQKQQTPIANLIHFINGPFSNHSDTPSNKHTDQKNLWGDKDQNEYYEDSTELQAYLNEGQKQKIQAAYSILQLQQQIKPVGMKDDLLAQLQHRNLKNKLIINTYLNRYQRKIRKRTMRQQCQKGYKSSSKQIKNTVNNQQASIFLSKIESLQIFSGLPKNHSQSLRKGDNLQLPLIASRQHRRTTVQK